MLSCLMLFLPLFFSFVYSILISTLVLSCLLDSATRKIMGELYSQPITAQTFDPALKQSLITLRKDIYPRYLSALPHDKDMSWCVVSCRVVSCCVVLCCAVMPCAVLSCLFRSCLAFSCLVLSCFLWSRLGLVFIYNLYYYCLCCLSRCQVYQMLGLQSTE